MNIILNYSEGSDHQALLKRIDFRDLAGPLSLDMGIVPFVKPASLSLLYAAFKLHSILYPNEKRNCLPAAVKSIETDVNRYMQRVNFFRCCTEFKDLGHEKFKRHDPSGRFVPIREISSMNETDSVAQEIVKIIFSRSSVPGEAQVKYALTELIDNALQHSNSRIGCVVQTQLYAEKFIEGVIVDCGIGIRNHLSRNSKVAPRLVSDAKAIEVAVEPFVSGEPYAGKRFLQEHTTGFGLTPENCTA